MGMEVMATKDIVMVQAMDTVILLILMAAAIIVTVMDILIIIPGATGMMDGMGLGQGQGQDLALEMGDEKGGQGGRILFQKKDDSLKVIGSYRS
jgi:hypothetical protein